MPLPVDLSQAAAIGEAFVRAASLSDLPFLVAGNAAMALETEHLVLDRDTLHRGCEHVLRDPSRGRYFVVCEPSSSSPSTSSSDPPPARVVGQLMITLEWSDWRASDVWWIQSVYVLPECRRKGHFQRLYKHARREAAEAKAAGLRLYAEVDNCSAHSVYAKLGMKTGRYQVFEDMFTQY